MTYASSFFRWIILEETSGLSCLFGIILSELHVHLSRVYELSARCNGGDQFNGKAWTARVFQLINHWLISWIEFARKNVLFVFGTIRVPKMEDSLTEDRSCFNGMVLPLYTIELGTIEFSRKFLFLVRIRKRISWFSRYVSRKEGII